MLTLSPYLGDSLDSSRSFLNSSLASSNLLFFSLYSSFILVLTNCSNILRHTQKRSITRLHIRSEISGFAHNRKTARIWAQPVFFTAAGATSQSLPHGLSVTPSVSTATPTLPETSALRLQVRSAVKHRVSLLRNPWNESGVLSRGSGGRG